MDKGYPSRLAERVRALAAAPSRLSLGAGGIAIARQHFDYDMLAGRLETVLTTVARRSAPAVGIGDHVTPKPSLRVGVVADLLEEGWPSMDLVADMLVAHLGEEDHAVETVLLRPAFRTRIGRLAGVNGRPLTIDRIINRFYDYPRWLTAETVHADVFHLVDHSYAHLVSALPRGRVVVTCHDTDAFRGLLGDSVSESRLPRRLARRC